MTGIRVGFTPDGAYNNQALEDNERLDNCILCGKAVFYLDRHWHHEEHELDAGHAPMVKPRYCRDCGSKNSWKRYPERDHLLEPSGKVFQKCYKCRECGKLTWYPVMT